MHATEFVLVEARDRVLTITLHRPAQKNAINHEVAVRLTTALDRLDADKELAVGGLTGAGGTFCGGHGPEGLCRRRAPDHPRPGLRWAHARARAQALDRRGRGLGARRRLRAG